MDKSGVGLCWDYFFPDIKIPRHLNMIQERDLWKFEDPSTKYFTSGLFFKTCCVETFDEKFTIFDQMMGITSENQNEVLACIELGKLLYQKQQMKIKHIVNMIKDNKYKFRDYTFIMYNCDSELTSDLGNELTSIYCDFAILWSYNHMTNYYHYSLRSTDKVNCAKLAQELLEGGGHSNAAGGKHKSHPNILFNCNI